MIDPRGRSLALMLLVCLAVLLLAAACGGPGGDPYQAGQAFRQQVDELLQTSGEFVAGFCGASLLPAFVTAVAAAMLGKRGH